MLSKILCHDCMARWLDWWRQYGSVVVAFLLLVGILWVAFDTLKDRRYGRG